MPVSGVRYQAVPCAQLGSELSTLDEKIAALSTQQRAKRVNDVMGWIFLGAPAGSLITADIRPQIAIHKGERDVAEQVMATRCGGRRF